MSKNQVRPRTANGTVVRLSEEEAALVGGAYKPVGEKNQAEEIAQAGISKMKVTELKAYAKEQGIDLGSASKKEEILAVIANSADAHDESDDE